MSDVKKGVTEVEEKSLKKSFEEAFGATADPYPFGRISFLCSEAFAMRTASVNYETVFEAVRRHYEKLGYDVSEDNVNNEMIWFSAFRKKSESYLESFKKILVFYKEGEAIVSVS
jgi:hypothetical protein